MLMCLLVCANVYVRVRVCVKLFCCVCVFLVERCVCLYVRVVCICVNVDGCVCVCLVVCVV